VWRWPPTPI